VVIGLSELRWPGEREITRDEYKIIYSERQDGRHEQEMRMVLRKEATQALIGYKPMGPRMTKARLHTRNGRATIVQVHAPITTATEQEIDEFYEEL